MKAENVEVRIYTNNTTEVDKQNGKIVGGAVSFKDADPGHPIIFLNQPGYSIQNQKNKKRVVFYDKTRKMLIKPSSIGGTEGTIDDMSVAVQQVIGAEGDTARELGVTETNKYMALLGFAAFAVALIFGMLTVYFMVHSAAPASSTGTTTGNTNVLGIGVVNTSAVVHIGTSGSGGSSGSGAGKT